MGKRTALAALAIGAMMAGCSVIAISRLEPGRSTEADVRAALGEPARTFQDAEGRRQLVYPQGPAGTQTYFATVTGDGRLVRFEDVLTEENLRRLSVGSTTADQVERLLGPPWRKATFERQRQIAWDYVIRDSWSYTVDFSVMFDERGIVASTASVRRETGRDGGMNR